MATDLCGEKCHALPGTSARYPEKIWVDVGHGEAKLHFEWLLANDEPPALLTDLIFAGVVNLAQRGTMTDVRPRRIELTKRRVRARRQLTALIPDGYGKPGLQWAGLDSAPVSPYAKVAQRSARQAGSD